MVLGGEPAVAERGDDINECRMKEAVPEEGGGTGRMRNARTVRNPSGRG